MAACLRSGALTARSAKGDAKTESPRSVHIASFHALRSDSDASAFVRLLALQLARSVSGFAQVLDEELAVVKASPEPWSLSASELLDRLVMFPLSMCAPPHEGLLGIFVDALDVAQV